MSFLTNSASSSAGDKENNTSSAASCTDSKILRLRQELRAKDSTINQLSVARKKDAAKLTKCTVLLNNNYRRRMYLKNKVQAELSDKNHQIDTLKRGLCISQESLTTTQDLHEEIVGELKDSHRKESAAALARTTALEAHVAKLVDDCKLKDATFNSLKHRHAIAKEALRSALQDVENAKTRSAALRDELNGVSFYAAENTTQKEQTLNIFAQRGRFYEQVSRMPLRENQDSIMSLAQVADQAGTESIGASADSSDWEHVDEVSQESEWEMEGENGVDDEWS